MPRVYTQVAAKDHPKHGIKKGDTYFSWTLYRRPTQKSLARPKPSQLTGSENLSMALAVGENLEDALAAATCPADVSSALGDAVTAAEEAMEGYSETISNLEEAFQGGCPALEEAQEKHDALEAYKSELEEAQNEVDNLDVDEYRDEEEDRLREADGEDVAEEFDDLGPLGKAAMLEAAREKAGEPSFGG